MEIHELTLKQVSEDLKQGKYSSKEITQVVIDSIKKKDDEIKAFVNITEEKALEAADKFDKSPDKDKLSKIAGVPGSLKDLFNWVDTPATASSNMLSNYISPYNATVTQRLLDNDAVFVGKTNLDSFAHGSSTETSDFFTTRNPWDTNRLPGGSSGGSAASVSAGMSIYSMGTETAGSIRQPSSWCGLTGLKPSYGRVSRYGVIAMGSSLDSPGPICKSVEDCAILLEALAGKDPKDATSHPSKAERYFDNLNADIDGLKIGLPKKYFDKDEIQEDVIKRVREALEELERAGAELVDIELMDPKYAIAVYTLVCRSEVSSNLARYDGIRYGHSTDEATETIDEFIAKNRGEGFGEESQRRIMTGTYALSSGYYDAYYKKAQKVRTMITQDLEKAFKNVDIIIGPTTPSTALKVGSTEGNPLFGEIADVLVEAGTLSGYPGLNVPVGFDKNDLPVGMNIVAPQFEEQQILNVGYAYQKLTDWHTKFPKI